MCTYESRNRWTLEKSTMVPGTRVTVSFELPHMNAKNWEPNSKLNHAT